jgi:hypothetical protein
MILSGKASVLKRSRLPLESRAAGTAVKIWENVGQDKHQLAALVPNRFL